MSSLTAIFGNSEEKSEDSEKLMELYWNRAELKKEFANMRKEQYRLQDRIKEHEGATARLQQKLDYLEDLLVDPEWAHNVVVFYQLRGLGKRSERKLARFAEQLKQQREKKQHSHALVDWNEQRKQEARELEIQRLEKRDQMQHLEDQLQSEQRRLASMSAFVRLFRGRSAMRLIDSLAGRIELAVAEDEQLVQALKDIEDRTPPDHAGLDTSAKRSINLMILSYAQQLYLQFDEDGIAALVKDSCEKSVGSVNYGTPYECQQLLSRIQKSTERMEKSTDSADALKRRAKMLGETAKFPNDKDAVPMSGSVSTVYRIDENGLVRQSEVNISGENYWGISQVLSR